MTDNKNDKGGTFDIYHFISRKDVIAAAVMVVALLAILAWKVLLTPSSV